MSPIIPITAPVYDSIIDITSQKDDWCFIAKVIRLWKSIELKEHAEVVTTDLVLMDCYGHKIQATIGRELGAKFANVLREDNVYVMYNFKVDLNELEVRTNTHKYILNFTNDTKVKCVHDGFLPIYSYYFTHPDDFLNHKYNPAVLVDVIGMLTDVAVENDYLIDGEMKKIVSMDLTDHGHSFKCILHGRCIDELSDFLLSGNSDNAVVALFLGKIEIWKGVPVVQNTTVYTKLLFNPNLDATSDLKQRMLGSQFTPYKNILPMSQDTKLHILDQWVFSNAKCTVSALNEGSAEPICVIMGTVEMVDTENGWWYLGCICHNKVFPDSGMYYCLRCTKHVSKVNLRYIIRFNVTDNTGTAAFVMHDRVATEFFGKPCKETLEKRGEEPMISYVPELLVDMVGKSFLLMINSKSHSRSRVDQCFTVSKITSDASLIKSFKHHYYID
ncbi:replication factor A protein [Trifolium repens]|nr:replication factor A protein [Trifolium repens]